MIQIAMYIARSFWSLPVISEALPWLEGALRFDTANARAALYLGMAYYFWGVIAEFDRRV